MLKGGLDFHQARSDIDNLNKEMDGRIGQPLSS